MSNSWGEGRGGPCIAFAYINMHLAGDTANMGKDLLDCGKESWKRLSNKQSVNY